MIMQVLKWLVLLWTFLSIMDFFFREISDTLDALTLIYFILVLIVVGYDLAIEKGDNNGKNEKY